jgi:arylsulfatase A-like enzyme
LPCVSSVRLGYYAEQSCAAGRASFITGQSGLRTGMTKVGLPGATLGLQKEDPTIAELLKPLGYAAGQFGKNHLGDRNWANPFTNLRVPKIFNLRTDPYERADITSNTYYDWLIDHVFLLVPAQDYVGQFLATFRDFQPRQKAPTFNMDEVLAKLKEAK